MDKIILYDAYKQGIVVNLDLKHTGGLWTQYVVHWGDKDLERITISSDTQIEHKYDKRTKYTINIKRL